MHEQNDVRVSVRVDRNLKMSADNLFERLGMNMTTALNIFLRKAVTENAIPFPVSASPAKVGGGYCADDVTRAFMEIAEKEIAYNQSQNFPVARYDTANGQAFLENSDGTRKYVRNVR